MSTPTSLFCTSIDPAAFRARASDSISFPKGWSSSAGNRPPFGSSMRQVRTVWFMGGRESGPERWVWRKFPFVPEPA
jgi:hypothetical protein